MNVSHMERHPTISLNNEVTVRTRCVDHIAVLKSLKRCNRMIDVCQVRSSLRALLLEVRKVARVAHGKERTTKNRPMSQDAVQFIERFVEGPIRFPRICTPPLRFDMSA